MTYGAKLGLLASAMTLAGCMGEPAKTAGSASARSATAALADAAGASKGTATVTDTTAGLRLVIDASGLAQGAHGLHVHTVGRCDAPDFASAGPHWNPTGKTHGKDAPGGPHWGDLPNLIVGTDGRGRLETVIPGTQLYGGAAPLMDADGSAIVIHASADDYRTDPSGNSGARIACGVFSAP